MERAKAGRAEDWVTVPKALASAATSMVVMAVLTAIAVVLMPPSAEPSATRATSARIEVGM